MRKRKQLDMWRLDPNWKFASEHGLASHPGIYNSQQRDKMHSILMCPCCLNIIHKQPVSLCQNPKQLSFLGYGFPLFYNMLIYCMISLFILILSQSSVMIYLSLKQDCSANRQSTYACSYFFGKISRVTTNRHQLQFDRIIRCLSFIGQFMFMIAMRDSQRKLAQYHKQRNSRIKDFSIIFKDLPKMTKIQSTIRQFIASLKTQMHIKIIQIYLIPKIDYFYQLQESKKQIIQHMKRIIKDDKFSNNLKLSLQQQLQRINLQLIQTCRKIDQSYQQDDLFSQKAIVILQNKEQKKAVLQQFKNVDFNQKEKYFTWMANRITCSSAPEPRQILWKNINYPKYRRWLRVLFGWILSIVFLAIATTLFYFLVMFKASSHSIGLLIGTILLIQFFNKYIMKIFLHWFSDIEKPQTSSQREFSYACKYTIGMFFTTAIMPLLVQAVIFQNIQFQYGVVEVQTIMFFFNAFIVNLLWILHPQYYIKKLIRWHKYGRANITQKQANQLMQDYPYDMGKRYAQIIQTMWFTFLYASLIPFGSFLSIFGLVIYYWVDKYNLLRRSKVVNTIQSKLPLQAVVLLEITLFWKPFGQLIFDIRLRSIVFPETIVMIALSIVFVFIPWNFVLDKMFAQKFNISQQTYPEVKFRFNQTYQTVDPIQRMLALQKFIQSQNKARKVSKLRQSRTMLEIRHYDSQQKKSDVGEAARQMTREEVTEDLSIILKLDDNSSVINGQSTGCR